MITIDNNLLQSAVLNYNNTPGIATGTDTSKGSAGDWPKGLIYFAYDTEKIYGINPITYSWINYASGGGGGGSQTFQQVLTTGSVLTTNNQVDIQSSDYFTFLVQNSNAQFKIENGSVILNSTTLYGTGIMQLSFSILQLNGTGITDTNAGGNSGEHLKVTINGTQYKIALLNP